MASRKMTLLCISAIFAFFIPQIVQAKEEGTEKEAFIVPVSIPKSGGVVMTPNAADVREKYERVWQNYWIEESYGKFRMNVHAYGYVNLPWPLSPTPGSSIDPNGMINQRETFDEFAPLKYGGNGSPIVDGTWTPGERFMDLNGDGSYTTMDPFWDTYGTTEGGSEHDYDGFGEEFVDWDGNVKYTTIDGLNPTGNVLIKVYDETLDGGRGPDSELFNGVANDGIVGSPGGDEYFSVSAGGNVATPIQWAERVLSVNELDLNANDYFSKLTTGDLTASVNVQGLEFESLYGGDWGNDVTVSIRGGQNLGEESTFSERIFYSTLNDFRIHFYINVNSGNSTLGSVLTMLNNSNEVGALKASSILKAVTIAAGFTSANTLLADNAFTPLTGGERAFQPDMSGDRKWRFYDVYDNSGAPTSDPDPDFNADYDPLILNVEEGPIHEVVGQKTYRILEDKIPRSDTQNAGARISTFSADWYRSPERYTESNGDGRWTDRDSFEDFLIRWEPLVTVISMAVKKCEHPTGVWPNIAFFTKVVGGWIPVEPKYVLDNYPRSGSDSSSSRLYFVPGDGLSDGNLDSGRVMYVNRQPFGTYNVVTDDAFYDGNGDGKYGFWDTNAAGDKWSLGNSLDILMNNPSGLLGNTAAAELIETPSTPAELLATGGRPSIIFATLDEDKLARPIFSGIQAFIDRSDPPNGVFDVGTDDMWHDLDGRGFLNGATDEVVTVPSGNTEDGQLYSSYFSDTLLFIDRNADKNYDYLTESAFLDSDSSGTYTAGETVVNNVVAPVNGDVGLQIYAIHFKDVSGLAGSVANVYNEGDFVWIDGLGYDRTPVTGNDGVMKPLDDQVITSGNAVVGNASNGIADNIDSLFDRMGDGFYQGPEAFNNSFESKMIVEGVEKDGPTCYSNWNPRGYANTAASPNPNFSVSVPAAGTTWKAVDFDVSSGRGFSSSIRGFSKTTSAGGVYPDADGYYDGGIEFTDMPSSIYHLAHSGGGGDLRLGEETDPLTTGDINGVDNSDNNPNSPNPPDGVFVGSGPYAYNIHGDFGYDGGNQLKIELDSMDWGTYSSTNNDANLDGLVDQGSSPGREFNNYMVDDVETGGVRTSYPFDRVRFTEDILELLDESVDFDLFFDDTNKHLDYVVGLIPGSYSEDFDALAGMGGAFASRDDDGFITFGGHPANMGESPGPFAMRRIAHEGSHDLLGYPDLYDYDVWNGLIVNEPMGAYDLMAKGGLLDPTTNGVTIAGDDNLPLTPITKYLSGWINRRDLRDILEPGVEQWMDYKPTEDNENQYYAFGKNGEWEEYYWLWYEAGENAEGWAHYSNPKGFYMIHVDGENTEGLPSQQRVGSHFTWELIQADGLRQLQDGVNTGDGGDLWPGSTNRTTFKADGPRPNALWWNEEDAGFEIRDIILPSNTFDPARILMFRKNQDVPEFEFIDPPHGESVGGNFDVKYWAFDNFGGTKIHLYRDNNKEGYDGTERKTLRKLPGDLPQSVYKDNISTLSDGGYYYYAFLEPSVGLDADTGSNVEADPSYFIFTPESNQGNGSLSIASVNTTMAVGNVITTNLSTLQTWKLVCITPGVDGEAVFSVRASVTGDEANLTAGTTLQTVNDYSGEVNFLVTSGSLSFDLGDSFTIRTTGRVTYSEAIFVIDGDTVPVNPNSPSLKTSLISGMTKEKGGEAFFSVRLNSKPTNDVVIRVSSSNEKEGVLKKNRLYFSTANWNVDQLVTVVGIDDDVTDGDVPYSINFSVSSSDGDYNSLDNIVPVNVVNKDDEIFGISINPPAGLTHEHGSTTTFEVVINSEPDALVRVNVTSEDTGEGVVSPAYLDFTTENWSAPQRFTVTGQDDTLVDANITYMLILNSTSEDNNFNEMIMTAEVTNVDDEIGAVTVGEVTGNTDESGRTSEFTVVLTTEPTESVSFTLISDTTTEGTVSPNIITFTPLSWNTVQTVTVTGVDDLTADGDKTYNILTGVAESLDISFNGLIISNVLMINEDDDTAGLTVGDVVGTVSEEGLSAKFSVRLNTKPEHDVTLPLSVDDFTEASLSKSSLTFSSSNWSGEQVVTVTGLDDIFVDGHVPFTVQLNPLLSADGNYNGLDIDDIELINIDNDSAKVLVGEVSGPTSEDGDQARFSMVLSSQPSADVTIGMISGSVSEGILVNDTVVFTENDWDIPQGVVVRGVSDNVQDGHIAYVVITAAAVSADPFYNGLEVDDVTVINLDSRSAYIRVSKISGVVSEEETEFVFAVSLTSEPGSDVNIVISNSDSTEASLSTSELVFTPVNYQGAQLVTVKGLDDTLLDGDIPFRVAVEPAVSGDSNYNKMDASDVFMTNLDNDQAGFKITKISGFTTEDGGEATFKVSLFTQPTNNVAFTLASSDTTEGTVSPQTMNFSSATWNIPLAVTVTGVNDLIMDGDVTYEILMSTVSSVDEDYSGLNVTDVTVLNVDNNSPGAIITDLDSNIGGDTDENEVISTFTIYLTSQPSSTVRVNLTSSDNTEGRIYSIDGNVQTMGPYYEINPTTASYIDFDSNFHNTPVVVTIKGRDDGQNDGNVSYKILIDIDQDPAKTSDASYRNFFDPEDLDLINFDNDSLGISVSTITTLGVVNQGTYETDETDIRYTTFEFFLNTKPTADVIVAISSSNEAEGKIIGGESVTFTRTDFNLARKVTIQGQNDDIDDGTVSYKVVLSATSDDVNYKKVTKSLDIFNYDDTDTAGFLALSTSDNTTTEGGDSDVISVVLLSEPTSDVRITLDNENEGEGSLSTSLLIFTPESWDTTQKVTLTGVDDGDDDGDVAYSIVVESTSSDLNYTTLSPVTLGYTNYDDDEIGYTLESPEGFLDESGSLLTFGVRLNSKPEENVTLSVVSSDTSEGTVFPSSITFTRLDWRAPHQVYVRGMADGIIDGDQSFNVTLTPSSADANFNVLAAQFLTLSNRDIDGKLIEVNVLDSQAAEGGDDARFSVSLSTAPSSTVTVSLSYLVSSQLVNYPSSLTFTVDNYAAAQLVVVEAVDDSAIEGNINYTMLASGSGGGYGTITSSATITVIDDDSAGVRVGEISNHVSEDGKTAFIPIVLTRQPASPVSLALKSLNTKEGIVSPATLSFSTLNWNVTQKARVFGVDDTKVDGDKEFDVEVSVESGPPDYLVVATQSLTGVNEDDDFALIRVSEVTGRPSEWGRQATFSIALNRAPSSSLSFEIFSSDTTEGVVSLGAISGNRMTFPISDWETAQEVIVTGVDDHDADGHRPFRILFSTITTFADEHVNTKIPDIELINTDDETVGVTVSPISGLKTSEVGKSATFTVVLNSIPSDDVVIGLSSTDLTEGTVSPSSLTFTRRNWNTVQTVTISGVPDDIKDPDILYQIILSPIVSDDPNYTGYDPDDVSVTNLSNHLVVSAPFPSIVPLIPVGEDYIFDMIEQGNNRTVVFSAADGSTGASDGNYAWSIISRPAFSSDTTINSVNGTVNVGPTSGEYRIKVTDENLKVAIYSLYIKGAAAVTKFERLTITQIRIFISDLDPTNTYYQVYYSYTGTDPWVLINVRPQQAGLESNLKGKAKSLSTESAFLDVNFEGDEDVYFKVLSSDSVGDVVADDPLEELIKEVQYTQRPPIEAIGDPIENPNFLNSVSGDGTSGGGGGGGGCFLK